MKNICEIIESPLEIHEKSLVNNGKPLDNNEKHLRNHGIPPRISCKSPRKSWKPLENHGNPL